jgi:hypothetical protein
MSLDTVRMLEEIATWRDPSSAAIARRERAKESARRRRRAQYIDRLAELTPPLTEAEKARVVRILALPGRVTRD